MDKATETFTPHDSADYLASREDVAAYLEAALEEAGDEMAESLPLAAVAEPLQTLIRRITRTRDRVTITDGDEPAAVIISAEELEDLEDQLAGTEALLREARGETTWVPHAEVKRRLGLDR